MYKSHNDNTNDTLLPGPEATAGAGNEDAAPPAGEV